MGKVVQGIEIEGDSSKCSICGSGFGIFKRCVNKYFISYEKYQIYPLNSIFIIFHFI